MLPVLCGYFNKIIGFLLSKDKQRMCEYLLLKTDGAIFDGLMKHMSHHSLALLTIELLQIQIKAEPTKKAGLKTSMYEWENSDQENKEDEAENEGVLTTEQQKMKQVLAAKGKQIVMGLLENMSAKN